MPAFGRDSDVAIRKWMKIASVWEEERLMGIQVRRPWALELVVAVAATLWSAQAAQAQAPQSFPLYCHGAGHMKTEILTFGSNVEVDTTFTWAKQGAGAKVPRAGECAWADRAPRDAEIGPGNTNFICDSGSASFHGIFGAGSASENSGENQPLKMAPIVVELPGAPQFGYVPGIVSERDKFFEFSVYRDAGKRNCMHVTKFVGEVHPPFSPVP
jgi:hypothetical protein